MRVIIITAFASILFAFQSNACSCDCEGDCSFSKISTKAEFVALVRVISHDQFLKEEILDYDGKMPLSMTVEVVKMYKGKEYRSRLKIWGDNGVLCRPYIPNFKIGEYFLIAPNKITKENDWGESPGDYTFHICNTDYLKVDNSTGIATGQYSKEKSKITLGEFEKKLE